MNTPFAEFQKIARFSRDCFITEKIDGSNATIQIEQDGTFLTGSRSKWITPENDNFGFSRWAHEHKDDLMGLGPGIHRGEWWGGKIQRGYGIKEKVFSLFNTHLWSDAAARPKCCSVVPLLATCNFDAINRTLEFVMNDLALMGSRAAPGFMDPEGVIIYHVAANQYFKKTLKNDDTPKSLQ